MSGSLPTEAVGWGAAASVQRPSPALGLGEHVFGQSGANSALSGGWGGEEEDEHDHIGPGTGPPAPRRVGFSDQACLRARGDGFMPVRLILSQ